MKERCQRDHWLLGLDITAQKTAAVEISTARAQAERAGELLDAVLNALPNPLTVKDSEGRYLIVNNAHTSLLGRQRKEFLGNTSFDFFPRD